MKYNVNVQYTIEIDVESAHEAAREGQHAAQWGANGKAITNINIGVALPFDYSLAQTAKLEAEKPREVA
jgi:hypothetical protein